MTKRPADLAAALSIIVSGCGYASAIITSFFASQAQTPTWVPVTLAVVGMIGQLASKLLTLQSNPSPPPGTASVVTPVKPGVSTVTVSNPDGFAKGS